MDSQEKEGGGGLVNMGLTCYGNAVIQNLRHLSKLGWIMEEGKYNTLFKRDSAPGSQRAKNQHLTRAFAEVIQFLGKCKRGQSVRPGNFWTRLAPAVENTLYEQFAMKTFHDSHEFFQLMIETIHQSTIQDVDMRIVRAPPTTSEETLVHSALMAWQKSFEKEYSPFVHMFYGLYHQKTICQRCMNVSHRWEPFNSLKVAIPDSAQPCDIMQCLGDDLMQEEVIEGYHCEKCGPERGPAKKSVLFWKLPLVIVMSLKRFLNNGMKIQTRAAPFPQTPVDFTPYFSENSPERKSTIHYTLRGIVDHHGHSRGGHYTAQCRSSPSGNWHVYDDESVRQIPSPEYGSSTYMLFLERV